MQAQGEGRGGGWMKKELGLSDDQAKKFEEVAKAGREAEKALMDKAKLDLDSLRLLVDKKAADGDLTAQIEKLKADKQAIEAQRQKDMDAKAAILSPMQQAKAAIMMADRMMHGGGMMWRPGRPRQRRQISQAR